MLTKELIDKFYEDVNSLGLEHPVAALSTKMKKSKGMVSEYLNKVKTPSEKFINLFYDKFYEGSKNVPRETNSQAYNEHSPDFIIGKLNGLLAGEQARRNDAERFYDKLLEKFGISLTDLSEGQNVLYSFARTLLEYHAAIASRGDTKKEKELLGILNTRLKTYEKMADKKGIVEPLRT